MDDIHEAVFECASCSRVFHNRKKMVKHLKLCKFKEVPTTESHECELCRRRFRTQKGVKRHQKMAHNIVVPHRVLVRGGDFECVYCHRKLGSKEGLRKHVNVKHENEAMEELRKREAALQSKQLFDCVYCGKRFTRKVNRNKHEVLCIKRRDQSPSKQRTTKNVSTNSIGIKGIQLLSQDEAEFPTHDILTQREESPRIEGSPSTPCSFVLGRIEKTPPCADSTLTPTLRAYVQDRPSFLKLRTPDISTPRRARVNLKYGQDTIEKYVKKIRSLQQDNRRLRDKVVTLKDLIVHLRRECAAKHRIADTVADTLTNLSWVPFAYGRRKQESA